MRDFLEGFLTALGMIMGIGVGLIALFLLVRQLIG